jgi:nucleotide-binding universal stress UspA family protein
MYQRVLVPLDGSATSECVLPHVESLAQGCQVKEVVLLRICDPPVVLADYPPNMNAEWDEHVRQETVHMRKICSSYLESVQERLRKVGIQTSSESLLGDPAKTILDYAVEKGVDLIIMATHGRSGATRWAYGSVADKVLRASTIPVLLVAPRGCRLRSAI